MFKLNWLSDKATELEERAKIEKLIKINSKKKINRIPIVKDIKKNKEENFFDFMDANSDSESGEFSDYLKIKSDSLNSLHNFPELKNLFLKYNTPLPSSAPVERVFSHAGLILSKKRGKLGDNYFEKILLLKRNSIYL